MGGSYRLKLEIGVARELAAACAALITQFDAIRRYVDSVDRVDGIGNLASGNQLEDKFKEKLKQLSTRLGEHIAFVTSLGDRFIAAGKTYAETDYVSASDLKALTDISLVPDRSKSITLEWKQGLIGEGATPTRPTILAPNDRYEMDGPTISPENGAKFSWDDLVRYQVASDMNPMMTVSEVFANVKDRTVKEVETLQRKIISTQVKDRWVGEGADAARKLTSEYSEEVVQKDLADSLNMLSANAKYTADWVGYLKVALAPMLTITDPLVQEKLLLTYREKFADTYVPGITTSDKSFRRVPPAPGASGTGTSSTDGSKSSATDGTKDDKKDDGTKSEPSKGGGGSSDGEKGGASTEGGPGPGPKGGAGSEKGGPGPGEGSKPDPAKPDPSKPKPEVPKPDPTQPKPEVPKPGLPGQPNPNVPGGNVPGLGPQVPNLIAPLLTALGQGVQMFGQMVQAGVQADAALKAALPALKLPEGVGPGPGEPPKESSPNGKGTPPAKPGLMELKAKAFPRASIPGRAGEVLMPPMPFGPGAGMPVMPPGGAGHNSSVQAQGAKPTKFLDEPFLEEFGIEPDAVRPVIES
ncbi:hypothetical protein [Nocardia altamirensis]|uniref:hypothetical protein n=1 Tax=Nocardia altamirensis TaxID=472158 RepID=UPI0008404111|nr:hypothetical protein [Nocardia altamirensis]